MALTGPEIAAYFKQHLSAGSSVYLPSDSNYTTQVAQRWDIFAPPTYIVAVKPALPKDVQKIVRQLSFCQNIFENSTNRLVAD